MSDMKKGACRRLPISRPCMSVMTSSTVSMAPSATSLRSSSSVTVPSPRFAGSVDPGHSYTPAGMDRNRPLIGITAYEVPASFSHWHDMPAVMVPAAYSQSVVAAGGLPVVIPPVEGTTGLLDQLQGLVLSGGSDLDAGLYGERQHPETLGVIGHRDRGRFAAQGGARNVRAAPRGDGAGLAVGGAAGAGDGGALVSSSGSRPARRGPGGHGTGTGRRGGGRRAPRRAVLRRGAVAPGGARRVWRSAIPGAGGRGSAGRSPRGDCLGALRRPDRLDQLVQPD